MLRMGNQGFVRNNFARVATNSTHEGLQMIEVNRAMMADIQDVDETNQHLLESQHTAPEEPIRTTRKKGRSKSLDLGAPPASHGRPPRAYTASLAETEITRRPRPITGYIFGLFVGALVSTLLFIFFLYSYGFIWTKDKQSQDGNKASFSWQHAWIFYIGGTVIIIFSLLSAFSKRFRCIMTLMFVSPFTAWGHFALLCIVIFLLLNGPLMELLGNMNRVPNIVLCKLEAFEHQSSQMEEQLITEYNEMNLKTRYGTSLLLSMQVESVKKLIELRKDVIYEIARALSIEIQFFKMDFAVKVDNLVFTEADFTNFTNTISLSSPGNLSGIRFDNGEYEKPINDIMIKREFLHITYLISRSMSAVLPIAALLFFLQSYCYLKQYRTDLQFENYFVTHALKALDKKRHLVVKRGLFPLLVFEKQHTIDLTIKRSLHRSEVCRLIRCMAVAILILSFGLLVYLGNMWVNVTLQTIGSIELPSVKPMIVTNSENHITFKDMSPKIQKLLAVKFSDILRRNSSSATFVGGTDNSDACAANIEAASIHSKLALGAWIIFLLISLFSPIGKRGQRNICSHFFKEREKCRISYLYYNLLCKRDALGKYLLKMCKERNRFVNMHIEDWCAAQFPLLGRLMAATGFSRDTTCVGCNGKNCERSYKIGTENWCSGCLATLFPRGDKSETYARSPVRSRSARDMYERRI